MRRPSPLRAFPPLLALALLFLSTSAMAGTSGASGAVTGFINQTTSWYTSIQSIAEGIFYTLFGIDFVYLVAQWLIGGKDVHEVFTSFIKKLLTIGFFYTVLLNGHQLIGYVINGFQGAATGVAGTPKTGLGWILTTGWNIFKACVAGPVVHKGWLWDVTHMGTAAVSLIVGALVGAFVGLVAILALIYLALEYLAIEVEAAIVASVGIIMMGFAGSRWTVQHAEGYLKYALSVGIRYFVLILWIDFIEYNTTAYINNLMSAISQSGGTNISTIMGAYANVLIFVLLIAWMAKKLPNLASSIMTGGSTLSGGDLLGAAVAAGAVGAAGVVGVAALGSGAAASGASGALTGAQAASAAGGAGGSAGALSGATAAAGDAAASGAAAGMENAVPAPPAPPESSGLSQNAVLPPSKAGSGGPAPSDPVDAKTVANLAKAAPSAGSGSAGDSHASGGTAGVTQGAAPVTTGAGETPGTTQVTEGAGAGPAGGSPADGNPADGNTALDTRNGAGPVAAEPGGTGTGSGLGTTKGQPLPTGSGGKSAAPGGTSAPSGQEGESGPAPAPTLQEAFQQAMQPMNESMDKLSKNVQKLAETGQRTPKFIDRVAEHQKRHELAEKILSPGRSDASGVQAAGLGLKHSE